MKDDSKRYLTFREENEFKTVSATEKEVRDFLKLEMEEETVEEIGLDIGKTSHYQTKHGRYIVRRIE